MRKESLTIWILLLILSAFIYFIPKINLFKPKEQKEITITMNTENEAVRNALNKNTIKMDDVEYKFKHISASGASIIVDEHNPEKQIDGYVKQENELYSPIVLIVTTDRTQRQNEISGLSYAENHEGYYVYSIDNIKEVLKSIEKEKLIEDSGFYSGYDQTLDDEKLKFVIPSTTSEYYPMVESFLYYVLNDYKIPNLGAKMKLQDQIKNIISKCKKVENINNYVEQKTNSMNSSDIEFCLVPECLYVGNKQNTINYTKSTVSFSYDLYIKKEDVKLVETLKEQEEFRECFNMRIKGRDFFYPRTKDIISTVYMQDFEAQ